MPEFPRTARNATARIRAVGRSNLFQLSMV